MDNKDARKPLDRHTKADGTEMSDVLDAQTTADNTEISEADIRERAYEIYVERGGVDGLDEKDWLQAEKELHDSLKSRRQKADAIPPDASSTSEEPAGGWCVDNRLWANEVKAKKNDRTAIEAMGP